MIHRLSRAALSALALTMPAAAQLPCGFNLLQNPGCEQGIAFWSDPAATWSCQTGPNTLGTTPAPRSGGGYFFAGVSSVAELYQDVSLVGYAVGMQFELCGFVAAADQSSTPYDQSQLELQCLDASGAVLATSTSAAVSSVLTWSPLSIGITTVPGSVTLRAVLRSIRSNGTNNDGYFDDLLLVARPVAGNGEDNGPGAGLHVNGIGPAGAGPFHQRVVGGSTLSLDLTSATSAPVVLLLGLVVPCASGLGCSGCLDLIGASPLVGGVTDAFGVFSLALPVPGGLRGVGIGLQAAGDPGGACPFELSAAFCLTIE